MGEQIKFAFSFFSCSYSASEQSTKSIKFQIVLPVSSDHLSIVFNTGVRHKEVSIGLAMLRGEMVRRPLVRDSRWRSLVRDSRWRSLVAARRGPLEVVFVLMGPTV